MMQALARIYRHCPFIADLTALSITLNPGLKQSITSNSGSMPVAFVIARIFLLKENYPCHTVRVQRCTATEHWQIYSTHYSQHNLLPWNAKRNWELTNNPLKYTFFQKAVLFFNPVSALLNIYMNWVSNCLFA